MPQHQLIRRLIIVFTLLFTWIVGACSVAPLIQPGEAPLHPQFKLLSNPLFLWKLTHI